MAIRCRVPVLVAVLAVGCGSPIAPGDAGDVDDVARGDAGDVDQGVLDVVDGTVLADTSTGVDAATDAPAITDAGDGASVTDGGTAGCGRAGMPVGYRNGVTLTSGGTTRTYAFSVPAGYDPSRPYPLVFVFHGDGGTGAGIRTGLPIEAAAGANAIFAYPDATTVSGRSFDLETPLATNPDIRFFQDLVASIGTQYCIDATRVFAAGHSRGGFFANILNCRIGTSVLRAVLPHSGSIYSADASGYTSDGHVLCEATAASAMLVHGATDTAVPITDGVYARDQWVWAHGCASTTHAYAPSPCVEYDGCAAPGRVVWCAIPGLGHGVWSMAGDAGWAFFDSFR